MAVDTIKRLLFRSFRTTPEMPERFRRRFTLAGIFVWCAMAFALTLGADTARTMGYQVFTVLGVIMLISLCSTFRFKPRLRLRRQMPRFGTVQQPLRYSIWLHNDGKHAEKNLILIERQLDPRPSFKEFIHAREPGEEKRNAWDRFVGYHRFRWLMERKRGARIREMPLPDLPPGRETDVTVEIQPLRRGRLNLVTSILARPDPFGLVKALHRVAHPDSVLILPNRYTLPPIDLPGQMKYQQGGVNQASSVGESEEFISLRDYRPGDPLRNIHWRSFARTGRPIVREFQDEFFVRTALVLDTFGVDLDVFEEAVAVAASFAVALDTQEALLDLLFVGTDAYCFTVGRGVGQTELVLEVLADVQTSPEKPFSDLTKLVLGHGPQVSGCVCVLLSWDEPRREFVGKLLSMQVPTLVLVLVPKGADTRLDLGPMRASPERFKVIPIDRIQETLATLGQR